MFENLFFHIFEENLEIANFFLCDMISVFKQEEPYVS